MKISTILLSVALAFRTIYSKAIDNSQNIIKEQLNAIEGDDSVEIVKSDNFIYKLHCSVSKEFCNRVKSDMEYAFVKISNAFEFYQPVVFETFVEDLKKYNSDDVGAVLTDTNYISLKSSNDSSPYMYPQSLAKQLNLNKKPDYKKNDFVMIINSCDECRENEFRSTYIHELMHGLGISNRNSVYKLDDNDVFDIEEIVSELFNGDGSQHTIVTENIPIFDEKLFENVNNIEEYMNVLNNSEVSKFPYLTVYDKNIVSLESGEKLFDSIPFYTEELNQKCLPKDGSPLLVKNLTNKFAKECFEKLSPETQETITHIINDYYFKIDSTGFLTNDGDIVALQTFENKFRSGSSIGHIRSIYNELLEKALESSMETRNIEILEDWYDFTTLKAKKEPILKYYDENYILYYVDGDDFTVEEMIELLPNNEKHPLIGDGIVKIMKTMGWTEKGEKRSNEIYYIDESLNLPENKSFEYIYRKKYEYMPAQNEEQPTFTIDEIETSLPIDSNETDIEVDVEVTPFIDQL